MSQFSAPDLLVPGTILSSVEKNQVSFSCGRPVHLSLRLLRPRPLVERLPMQYRVQGLQLEHSSLHADRGGLLHIWSRSSSGDQQVHPATPQPVFPVQPSPAIHNPL